ncbi:hypothetical protein [Nocardia miyunensis]|uniref:hypothetical protein n=1 Tax=Nocardia miyunensis TaxID=282684 RepID=UPI000829A7E3|nr:hypothetical protein [Nocardia miyunensis]
MLAITLYALALRDQQPIPEVTLSRILVPLLDRDDFLAQAKVLSAAGHDLDTDTAAGSDTGEDPVAQQWKWLLRTWDPQETPGARWDGMTRGIARGLADPAIDVLHSWARGAVEVPLVAQRGGLAHRTTVEVTTGPHAGVVGHVEVAVFERAADDRHDLAPGPPARYGVNLGSDHGFRIELIAAEHISVIESHPA